MFEGKGKAARLVLAAILIIVLAVILVTKQVYVKERAIQTADDAIAVAKPAFAEKYGNQTKYEPFVAEHNRRDGTWHIYGTLPEGHLGGTPEAIISEQDGRIISIWHGK